MQVMETRHKTVLGDLMVKLQALNTHYTRVMVDLKNTFHQFQELFPINYLTEKLQEDAFLEESTRLLGDDKVISYKESTDLWKIKSLVQPSLALYPENLVAKCARDNKKKLSDWRLVYLHGLSINELISRIKKMGDPIKICKNPNWDKGFLSSYGKINQKSGYFLIDFKGKFGGLNWNKQEQKIRKLPNCIRAPESHVLEALILFNLIKPTNLTKNLRHWGPSVDYLEDFRISISLSEGSLLFIDSGHVILGASKNSKVCIEQIQTVT